MIRLGPRDPVDPPRPVILTPPRPNPGPEPWRDEFPIWIVALLLAIGTGLALAWKRRRRRRAVAVPPTLLAADDSPEARLLALCDRLRSVLTSRLGPGLRAWTTEEIASDPRTIDLLKDNCNKLAAILRAGDRLKFARRHSVEELEEQLADWASWADALEATLRQA